MTTSPNEEFSGLPEEEDVRQLDLSDPDVREMARYNHRPEETWSSLGTLLHVSCTMCGNRWPCQTVLGLRHYQ